MWRGNQHGLQARLGLGNFRLSHRVISPIKINQTLIVLILLNRDNAANKNSMGSDFLNLLNLTIKTHQRIL